MWIRSHKESERVFVPNFTFSTVGWVLWKSAEHLVYMEMRLLSLDFAIFDVIAISYFWLPMLYLGGFRESEDPVWAGNIFTFLLLIGCDNGSYSVCVLKILSQI